MIIHGSRGKDEWPSSCAMTPSPPHGEPPNLERDVRGAFFCVFRGLLQPFSPSLLNAVMHSGLDRAVPNLSKAAYVDDGSLSCAGARADAVFGLTLRPLKLQSFSQIAMIIVWLLLVWPRRWALV